MWVVSFTLRSTFLCRKGPWSHRIRNGLTPNRSGRCAGNKKFLGPSGNGILRLSDQQTGHYTGSLYRVTIQAESLQHRGREWESKESWEVLFSNVNVERIWIKYRSKENALLLRFPTKTLVQIFRVISLVKVPHQNPTTDLPSDLSC